MAGDWIKMRGNLWDDPRVAKLCDLTEQGEAAIVGGLYWLWATADQHTEDGAMPGLTLRQIDRKTGIAGFGAGLVAIGWLRDDEGGVVLEKFEEHNGTSAKRRCTDAQRKANSRTLSASDADTTRTDEGQKAPTLGAREREEKEKKEIPSVPNGTDGVPPAPEGRKAKNPEEMAKAELWQAAVSVLEAGGCPKSQCRTFMGKLVQDYTLPTVQQAVAAAVSAQPADAREYLKATCQRLKGERKEPLTVASDAAERTARELAEQEARAAALKSPEEQERIRQAIAKARGALKVVA